MHKTLLPTGCYDLLPPLARQEAVLSSALLSVFEGFGYAQVAPPLLEYTENLLAGRGAGLSAQTYRVMDSAAGKVMGIRPDITLQIARIACTRLADSPRPLRLCYNGLIMRMQPQGLSEDRQLRQAGIELIGAASPEADAEVIIVAAQAMQKAGVKELSIDLNLPGIVGALLAAERMENTQVEALLAAVAHKDVSAVRGMNFAYRDTLAGLMQCAGPASAALPAIERLDLPESARQQCRDLAEVVRLLTAASDGWAITIDATENRGLSYHSGIHFSIFVPGAATEVGRGGRYTIHDGTDDVQATGFTLYVDGLRDLLPPPPAAPRVYMPAGMDAKVAATLQAQGFVCVAALPEFGSGDAEAKRLGCTHVFEGGALRTL